MNKSLKTVAIVATICLSVLFLSSCNRGGYGCPYELKAPSFFSVR